MPIQPVDLMPSIEKVALLLRQRTVGVSSGLGGDTGPGDITTFTDTTRPSAQEVQDTIATAYDVVVGMIRGSIIPELIGTVKHAISLYATVLVEVSFFGGRAENALKLWRELFAEAILAINDAIESGALLGQTPRGSWASIGMSTNVRCVTDDEGFEVGV